MCVAFLTFLLLYFSFVVLLLLISVWFLIVSLLCYSPMGFALEIKLKIMMMIAAASANLSTTSLRAMFLFGARNFHSRRIWYD